MSLEAIQSLKNSVEPQNSGEIEEQKSYRYLLNEPIKDSVNFKGSENNGSRKKNNNGFLKGFLILLTIAAAGIGGMGILGKNLSKISTEKWYGKLANKDFVKKSADVCYGWCKNVKGWGNSAIDWVKNLGKKK